MGSLDTLEAIAEILPDLVELRLDYERRGAHIANLKAAGEKADEALAAALLPIAALLIAEGGRDPSWLAPETLASLREAHDLILVAIPALRSARKGESKP